MIIGLTGTNASGKTWVVEYLKKKGFQYFSLSDIIREELTNRGLIHSRDNMRTIGNKLRTTYGSSVLADRICNKIQNENTVIDSIRNTNEIKRLLQLDNFYLIAIDAPIKIRFERSQKRGRVENAQDLYTFQQLENKEKSSVQFEQNLHQCMEMAMYSINNDGSLEELKIKIENILKQIQQQLMEQG